MALRNSNAALKTYKNAPYEIQPVITSKHDTVYGAQKDE